MLRKLFFAIAFMVTIQNHYQTIMTAELNNPPRIQVSAGAVSVQTTNNMSFQK
ncbi:hypothetical protein LC040_17700 [Bacillus tianshenii]|nr:hypothetical protein LC040_17700 [Bacillus tianshenii]